MAKRKQEKSGMRTVVVGASSGLGRCIAAGLGKRGASVALMARRKDRLADAAKEAGPKAVAIECDVTQAASCRDAIEEAASRLGGIDSVVYAPAIGQLKPLVELDGDTWRKTFETNVTGAALFTAAAIPHLTASRGVAVFLTSVSASLTPPWPGLAAYVVSKAALDKLIEAFRVEHPAVGFTRVIVGNCGGGEGGSMTEFNAKWDPALTAKFVPGWVARGYLDGLIAVEELVNAVDTILRCGSTARIPSVTVVQRPAAG